MKKFIIPFLSILMPLMMSAQAQIDTKKMKIADFTEKVTKVVLTGNEFFDACLKQDIVANWTLSPYEFCTLEEFDKLKVDDDYYFLMLTQGQFNKEAAPGIFFLTLIKGGEKAGGSINDMLEIVSVPFASIENPSGREYTFLRTLLDVIQNYTLDSMDKDLNAYLGLPNYSLNLSKSKDMKIVFSENDLSSEINAREIALYFDDNMVMLPEEKADKYLTFDNENVIVSYVVVPADALPGSYCYKMLIEPRTNTLYYFRKHKVSRKFGAGFLEEDIKRIASHRHK